eukprot:TRINITY_DN198_c0_g1_i4.p1 TRINITY_DN198_c0_g1~~TRINITY_DN198_c0_g1_i4.p1  ORF type:complete len:609 (+),score=94.61 TRINITY_DN198_c0_g1_i4:52-1878(+)
MKYLITTLLLLVALFCRNEALILRNPYVIIGVDYLGQLNAPYQPVLGLPLYDPLGINYIGLRTGDGLLASTEPGCLCEGWGAYFTFDDDEEFRIGMVNSYDYYYATLFDLSLSGVQSGIDGGKTGSTLAVDYNNFISVRHDVEVLDAYPGAVKFTITITNLSTKIIKDLVYRRLMDWDIYPTPFSEFVKVEGGAAALLAGKLERFCDNGFEFPDSRSCLPLYVPINTDYDTGPRDVGSLFDVKVLAVNNIANLQPGASASIKMYYGTSPNYASARALVSNLGLEVVSYGRSSDPNNNYLTPNDNSATFIWGFKGFGLPSLGSPCFYDLAIPFGAPFSTINIYTFNAISFSTFFGRGNIGGRIASKDALTIQEGTSVGASLTAPTGYFPYTIVTSSITWPTGQVYPIDPAKNIWATSTPASMSQLAPNLRDEVAGSPPVQDVSSNLVTIQNSLCTLSNTLAAKTVNAQFVQTRTYPRTLTLKPTDATAPIPSTYYVKVDVANWNSANLKQLGPKISANSQIVITFTSPTAITLEFSGSTFETDQQKTIYNIAQTNIRVNVYSTDLYGSILVPCSGSEFIQTGGNIYGNVYAGKILDLFSIYPIGCALNA